MSLKVLYLGGTGEVSFGCIQASLELGQDVTVYNRGTSGVALPEGAKHIRGDVTDESAYAALGQQGWDAVCQFRSYDLTQCERDESAFAGHVGQFVFISTAMVYQRPPRNYLITEDAPRGNSYSDYARKKMEIEDRLLEVSSAGKLPVTIVRPSHTIRTHFPGNFISDDEMAWRMLHGLPIVSHGDGAGLWALTRTEDFGQAFSRLLGNKATLGQAYHITTDTLHPWDRLIGEMARSIGAQPPRLVHVATDTLVRYRPDWAGTLLADKTWSFGFDNSKVKSAVGGWECKLGMEQTIGLAAPHVLKRLEKFTPDPALAKLLDRIVNDQSRLGHD